MSNIRTLALCLFLLPSTGCPSVGTRSAPAADPSGFRLTAPLASPRSGHTATLLADGRVLAVGGEDIVTRDPLRSVEVFDPETETWNSGSPLPEPRSNHRAVLLADGRVLVMGGGRSAPIGAASGVAVLSSALLYDAEQDRWTTTGSMLEGRSHFEALLLPSGKVLVAGGGSDRHDNGSECTGSPNCGPLGDTLASAELYDPEAGTFSATGSMRESRSLFTLTMLSAGQVIAAAGMNDSREGFRSTEVYGPESDSWHDGPQLASEERVFHSAASLPSGRLLIGGGKLPDTHMLATVDVVDLDGRAMVAPSLSIPHTVGRFVELESGRVLSVGGFQCPNPCTPIGDVEVFDEQTMSWSQLPPLQAQRAGHTATRLADGRVLVVGGFDSSGNTTSCEISVTPSMDG
jgi:hypothetical protein